MDSNLFFKVPPPLDPAWLAHEQEVKLLEPKPIITDPKERQALYNQRCKDLNTFLLNGRDKHLTGDIKIHDAHVGSIPIRLYYDVSGGESPSDSRDAASTESSRPTVIYYHGGGLVVGDLDSEDLTCRRICKALHCTVYSVGYRLMPEFTADDALDDAVQAFKAITSAQRISRLIIMGSSSGGQLAAQVLQQCKHSTDVHGVLLRGPVTCDATEDGKNLPKRRNRRHTSMNEAFHTSLLANAALTANNRTTSALPLEVEEIDLRQLPRHWIQVTTNDIYYSDGVCYAKALREADVEVKLDVVRSWPHTFWLKAPLLERAVQVENDMIEGLRWLLENEVA